MLLVIFKLQTQTRNGFQKVFKSLPALTTRVVHRPRTLLFLREAQAHACGRVSNLTFRKSILLTAGLGERSSDVSGIIMTNFLKIIVPKELLYIVAKMIFGLVNQ